MESINKKSSLQNTNAPVERGLTSLSPKQVSNKNYLVKQTSPLNSILCANKKTLGPQEVSWTTATKTALASTGMLSALGLSYLGYQYFGAKPTPSPSIIPHISIGNLVGTTIKVVGGLGLLALMYSVLGKREPANPIDDNSFEDILLVNKPVVKKKYYEYKPLETQIMESFEAAEKEFKTNINHFADVCEEIVRFLNQSIFPDHFIETFLVSIQKKITNPDERTSNHSLFSMMIESLFEKLLLTDSALEIAKTCVKVKNISINGQTPLFRSCQSIIKEALRHSEIGLKLAIDCAKEKKSPEHEQVAREAAVLFLMQEGPLFGKFLLEIALGDNENLQESIIDEIKIIKKATELVFTTYYKEEKTKAFTKIQEIFDIFIEAKNYKMATSLLQKCIETGDKSLQNLAEVYFYAHEDTLIKFSPLAANQLSNHFQKSSNKSKDHSFDPSMEETQDISEETQETRFLNG
jgi:hypothetical protein